MKLFELTQKFHNGEVHTLDINSANSLVATGGSDHHVNVWGLEQFTDVLGHETSIEPSNIIRPHQKTVKLVKWSPTEENQLISADESGELIITDVGLDISETIYRPSASKKYKNITVLDGSWSKDGRLFVWSTIDGAVHIYDTMKKTHQLLISHAKSGEPKVTLQRSIAFDPNGKYLVLLGDDTMVTVYKYEYDKTENYQFQVTNRVSKLMSNSAAKAPGSNYRRVSWSCDGEFFAVPNATKQLTSVVCLLSVSSDWDNNISLVGHDEECDLVKFAPHIFESKAGNENDSNQSDLEILDYEVYHIIATAGSDCSLILWNTTKETPLFVMRNVSSRPLVDLAWDKSGRYILMATLDGKVIVVGFAKGELGEIVSSEFLDKFRATQEQAKKHYSKAEPQGLKKLRAGVDVINQKEATSNYLEQDSDANDTFLSAEQDHDSESPEAKLTHMKELIPHVLAPSIRMAHSPNKESTTANLVELSEEHLYTKPPQKRESRNLDEPNSGLSQKTTMKNGKKRVQPTAISNGNSRSFESPARTETRPSAQDGQTGMAFNKPSFTVSADISKDFKREKATDEGSLKKKAKRELEPIRFLGSVVTNPTTTFAQVRLSSPKTRAGFRISDSSFVLEVKNGQGNESAPSRVTCLKEEVQVWSDFIPQYIHLAAKGSEFWALTTVDGTIHTYSSTSGKRLLPPVVLGSPISFLESKNHYLMAITTIAEVFVWDLQEKKIHMRSPSSLAALLDSNSKLQENRLSKSDNITMCSITSSGLPVATLSNGSGYIYNIQMEVWQTVTEAWWAFGSHYWDSLSDEKNMSGSQDPQTFGQRDGSSIISILEHRTNEELLRKSRAGRGKFFSKISKNMMMKEGFENLENTVSLSHLENRILCSELLQDRTDFQKFVIIYANRLCELGLQAKLFELCETILSESLQTASASKNSKICGIDRRNLLKDVLIACTEHRDAQRILVHFGNKIGLIHRDYE